MDPARMFKESLTSRPELENSQGQFASFRQWSGHFRSSPINGHRQIVPAGPVRQHRTSALRSIRDQKP